METLSQRIQRLQKDRGQEDPFIDPLVQPLCELLNHHGYHTVGSCSGHIRWLIHKNRENNARAVPALFRGSVQLYTTKEKMRVLWHAINEYNQISPIMIRFCVHSSEERKNEMNNYQLTNMIALDFLQQLFHTDQDLYTFHRDLYTHLKTAFEKPIQYAYKAGEAFDRHAYDAYIRNYSSKDEAKEKKQFSVQLEELEWLD